MINQKNPPAIPNPLSFVPFFFRLLWFGVNGARSDRNHIGVKMTLRNEAHLLQPQGQSFRIRPSMRQPVHSIFWALHQAAGLGDQSSALDVLTAMNQLITQVDCLNSRGCGRIKVRVGVRVRADIAS